MSRPANEAKIINIGDKLYLGAYGWITIKDITDECGSLYRSEPYEVVKAEAHDGSELMFKLNRKEA